MTGPKHLIHGKSSYNLSDGRYKFNLLSVNEDGLTQDNPLTFEINIKKPVWRTWWFILSLLGTSRRDCDYYFP